MTVRCCQSHTISQTFTLQKPLHTSAIVSQLKVSLFPPRPGTLANLLARDGGMGIFEEINIKADNTFDKFIGNCEEIYVLKMKIQK